MPDALLRKVKTVAAKRKTTFRSLVVDALERTLNEEPSDFQLEDASAGTAPRQSGDAVSSEAINAEIDAQRDGSYRF